jgi:uncharacterized protein YprB with RNaseH-like and TPR domain
MRHTKHGFVPAITLKMTIVQNNTCLEEVEVATTDGCCLVIESVHPIPKFFVSEEQLRNKLMHELTLVYGIGKRQEQRCHKRGIRTLTDLRSTNWKIEAQKIAKTIQNGTQREIIELLHDTGRGTNPLLNGFVAAASKENLLFFDIETFNRAHSPIILFGCGVCDDQTLRVTQYLLRNSSEEIAGLEFVTEMMRMHPILVTYNGKTFDLPVTNKRLTHYNKQKCQPMLHFDLLHSSRRIYHNNLGNCCLRTLEKYLLSYERKEEIPSYLVPAYYQKYLRTGDPSLLKQIVDHNQNDIVSLVLLLAKQTKMTYET